MRRSLPVNVVLVVAAAMAALVLTVVQRTPEGLVSFQLDAREVRAAPGAAAPSRHDLTALEVFNFALIRIKERYVDPTRIDPHKMLYQALDSVQFNIPEVLVEPDPAADQLTIAVNDKRETFATGDVKSLWRLASTLKRVFRFIQSNMNSGADLAKVEYAAVNGMLSTLDPHSNLMDPEAARDMDVSTSGKFGGLGIVIQMVDRKLTVIRPMKDTPAWRAGIKAGDHISRINAEPTDNLTSDEAVDRMRGIPGTPVTLTVERKGAAAPLRVDLVRAEILVSSVHYKLLDKHVGMIRIGQFQGTTGRETEEAMRKLAAQGATAWVLDLRGNPGGLLEQSVDVVDLFVDRGAVVTTVSTRGREVHDATRGVGDTQSSVAVLVNRGSASASEIVAGALKNFGRAIIIGTRTFGKGSVQELYDNDADGSKLKLTAAQYLTPGDRSIQNVGIVPDIELQRMYVPEQNDDIGDIVRLLPPSRSYAERELDAHLDSEYAPTEDEQPSYQLPYLIERTKAKAKPGAKPDPAPTTPARATARTPRIPSTRSTRNSQRRRHRRGLRVDPGPRPGGVEPRRPARGAHPRGPAAGGRTTAAQQAALAGALGKLGVDWSAAPAGETGTASSRSPSTPAPPPPRAATPRR
ncbi:MAG: S41 family peptidase [Kofleriaceae bacterium]